MADKKSWVEITLMPLVVAVVGVVGTLIVTHQQEINAQVKADSDRQVKVLEIFADKISSPKERERKLALRMLEAIDGELAAKLAAAVADTETNVAVRGIAQDVEIEATARATHTPRVYLHIEDERHLNTAKGVADTLEEAGLIVPRIEVIGEKSPRSPQLRYFRKAEKSKAEEIHQLVNNAETMVQLRYFPGYEDSTAIQPMHFELWFGRGS